MMSEPNGQTSYEAVRIGREIPTLKGTTEHFLGLIENCTDPIVDSDWFRYAREALSHLARADDFHPEQFAAYTERFHAVTQERGSLAVDLDAVPAAMGKLATSPEVQLELMNRNFAYVDDGWRPLSEAETVMLTAWVSTLELIDPSLRLTVRQEEEALGVTYMSESAAA